VSPRSVRIRAPAKVNLGLRVLGALKDGTHSIETIFQAVDLFDGVEMALAEEPGVRLTLHGRWRDEVPAGTENLAARAAGALLDLAAAETGVEIRLTKRIPPGAGLGGGSSDAAAVLHGLALLLGSRVRPETVEGVAAALGADVPFFLRGGRAFGFHRGTHLLPLPALPDYPALVVVPDVQVSTFWAYSVWDERHAQGGPDPGGPPLRVETGADALPRYRNDFEAIVFERFPEIADVHGTLAAGRPLVARLSGTGSACFALYRDAAHRDREAERAASVYRHRSDYNIFRVRLFSGGVESVA
jgi:4-diphosphocytidyl-2-C-methyl-D-erythritol kinase